MGTGRDWISPEDYPLKNPDWRAIVYGGQKRLHYENDSWYFNQHNPNSKKRLRDRAVSNALANRGSRLRSRKSAA